MGVVAFDLDGVLAAPVPQKLFAKSWRKMNGQERAEREEKILVWYRVAPALFAPLEKTFFVVTARKNTIAVRAATENWLREVFPRRVLGLYMLDRARNVENVVAHKTKALFECGAEDFSEDNRTIVNALRKQNLRCRIWHYKKGRMVLDYEPGFC